MHPKQSACLALMWLLATAPTQARPLFNDTRLPDCQRVGEDRTPVPYWEVFLSKAPDRKPPPPPQSAGGTIVYIDLSYPSVPVDPDKFDCTFESNATDLTFEIPNDKERSGGDGLRIHLHGEGHFKRGDCVFSGFYVSDAVSGIRQGWTDVSFRAVDESGINADRYCLGNPPHRPGHKSLPPCDRVPGNRIPIPRWNPALTAAGELASAPPRGDGKIVYISFSTKKNAHGTCAGWSEESFVFLLPRSQAAGSDSGLLVKLRGNDRSESGSCRVSGLFMNEPLFERPQGLPETYFGAVDQDRVVSSEQFCLAGDNSSFGGRLP
jgi:hypothetical protein